MKGLRSFFHKLGVYCVSALWYHSICESGENMRIEKHPILEFSNHNEIAFFFNGKQVIGRDGDTIASALHALGIKELSKSIHYKRSRGFYCAIGNCGSCNMTVNDVPNVRTCMTKLEPGMRVVSQPGKGELL